jgi:hypothetical protein
MIDNLVDNIPRYHEIARRMILPTRERALEPQNMDDFDRSWRQKLAKNITSAVGADLRDEILHSIENINCGPEPTRSIGWTRQAIELLEDKLTEETCRDIMTGCACHYPLDQLESLRALYLQTRDIKLVHAALQEQFETFLRHTLQIDETMIADVISRGWGAAGILEKRRIIATKIPKSGYLERYLQESDPEQRRSYYCHCPRVRDAVASGQELPKLYCYCGAGFYRHMWETILQSAIQVEVLESVLSGGEVCKVLIKLPPGG